VVVNANFWDVVRMTKFDMGEISPQTWELSNVLLASWMRNFTTWVDHLRTKLPDVGCWQGGPQRPAQHSTAQHSTAPEPRCCLLPPGRARSGPAPGSRRTPGAACARPPAIDDGRRT
jgi:hypothetical protein